MGGRGKGQGAQILTSTIITPLPGKLPEGLRGVLCRTLDHSQVASHELDTIIATLPTSRPNILTDRHRKKCPPQAVGQLPQKVSNNLQVRLGDRLNLSFFTGYFPLGSANGSKIYLALKQQV